MRPLQRNWGPMLLAGGLTVLLAGLCPALASAQDAVERLRQALPIRSEDAGSVVREPAEAVLQHRKNLIEIRIRDLKTLTQLRRAFALEEWKDDTTRHDKLRRLDAELRGQIGKRLADEIRAVVASGDNTSKLAVANLIAEMGPSVRSIDPRDRGGFARTLTAEVKTLAEDKNLAVRQEALRALGNINAPPHDVKNEKGEIELPGAIPALQKALQDKDLGPRRLAADALGQMMRVGAYLQKQGRAAAGVDARPVELVDLARSVVEAAIAGLDDKDAQVRALSLIAIEAALDAGVDQVADAFASKMFPPAGREPSEEEAALTAERAKLVQNEIAVLAPLLKAFRGHAPRVLRALDDPETMVRLAALQALDSAAEVRLRARRRVLSVPTLADGKSEAGKTARAFLAANDPLGTVLPDGLSVVAAQLAATDLRQRRAVLEFLELLEEGAAPAKVQVAAATSDRDRFVRWGAARVLSLLPLSDADITAPALARLLSDSDFNVRLTAAQGLEALGHLAGKQAGLLAAGAADGDVETRVAAMAALQKVDPKDAQVAVPQLTDALKNPDPRIRRAACDALSHIGPLARDAVPALRTLLGDEDNEVRVKASDAILSILRPGK